MKKIRDVSSNDKNITSFVSENNGEIYFKGIDVAEALGYADANDAVRRHVWEEDKIEWSVLQQNLFPGAAPGNSIRGVTKFVNFLHRFRRYSISFALANLERSKRKIPQPFVIVFVRFSLIRRYLL